MAASSQNNGKIFGRFDPIHIFLAVISIIFLILSIVFIILFATKHDSSSGFLATGFSDGKAADVANEWKGLLNNKYTVNSFALDIQNKAVSAVFSLRDSVSTAAVQNVLSASKLVTQTETTYGDKATAVCRQQQIFGSPSTGVTAPVTSITTTQATPIATKYCNSNPINRDIVIVVDMNDLEKNNHTEKIASLTTIRDKLIAGITFPQVNIFLKAVVANDVIDISTPTNWISNSNQLNTDFGKLLAVTNFNNQTNLIIGDVFSKSVPTFKTGRQYVSAALFVITDKLPSSNTVISTDPKKLGIYVGITGVRSAYMKSYDNYDDKTLSYETWTELSEKDPFATFVCSFYELPAATQMKSFFEYPLAELDDQINKPTCEVLDIIIAFDISESLSRIIVPKYVAFAKSFVAQYKYKGNEFTRVGVLTFNNKVTEKLKLTDGNTLEAVNAAIDTVAYEGGLTDVTLALTTAKNTFIQESDTSRSRVLIVLSDAVPTVDTIQDEIQAGKDLAKIGVAVFFVGYSNYSPDVLKTLGQVTNPDYVFGDMSQASLQGITNEILITYPCPQPKCVTAYYAVEVSESTDDYVVQNLQDVLAIATFASSMQSDTASYQLITYNDGNTLINPKGDASFNSFKTFVEGLINDPSKIAAIRSGYTRLDTAIDDITAELKNQAAKNSRFSGNIIFMGQANDGVLNPDKPEDEKIALLKASATNLQAQTAGLIYVVDDSKDKNNFGDDLWPFVTTANRIIPQNENTLDTLKNTDYFATWSKLSCSLPALSTCYDTPLDVAVVIDLQNKDYNFINYITTLLSRFSSQDDTHISMLAYGSRQTTVLSNLAVHSPQDVQNFAVEYEDWRNGTYFITTTTQAPTTSEKPKNFWSNELYQVDQNTIKGVFDSLGTQFGCGHYSDNGDRIFAPNLFIFASDNFGTYTNAVWDDFSTEVRNRYGCWDCAGNPTFLFLSRNEATAPVALGVTYKLSDTDLDIDATDDTSTQANINKFNSIVNSVCVTPLATCASYTKCTPYV
uniref:VWFA domain-containing protein n=1 Tax=Caenorhabditis tropicalis TaxID=1561998 RepID=A0A1I7TUY5_9PELO